MRVAEQMRGGFGGEPLTQYGSGLQGPPIGFRKTVEPRQHNALERVGKWTIDPGDAAAQELLEKERVSLCPLYAGPRKIIDVRLEPGTIRVASSARSGRRSMVVASVPDDWARQSASKGSPSKRVVMIDNDRRMTRDRSQARKVGPDLLTGPMEILDGNQQVTRAAGRDRKLFNRRSPCRAA